MEMIGGLKINPRQKMQKTGTHSLRYQKRFKLKQPLKPPKFPQCWQNTEKNKMQFNFSIYISV